MENSTEYQIFVGCNDPDLHDEVVTEAELREMVTSFFEREEIDFSMLSGQGGYIGRDGSYVDECQKSIFLMDLMLRRIDNIIRKSTKS